MTTELLYLVLVAALTGVMFVPYVLNRIAVWGLADTVGYPENPKPQTPWAKRMKAAHANAVENLVVFAPLVLVVEVVGVNNGATAAACMVYFWARVAHLGAYTFAIPWLRTLAFTAGFLCQAVLAWQCLAA